MTHDGAAAGSAGVHQACDDVAGSPAILSLGVSDRAVLLSEVKPQLTLVSEVEVTFFTLRGEKKKEKSFRITFQIDSFIAQPPTAIVHRITTQDL